MLIENEQEKLLSVKERIEKLHNAIIEKTSAEELNRICDNLNKNMEGLEKIIMTTKRSKFDRDVNDYKTDKVYEWRNRRPQNRGQRYTPRPILKQNRNVYFPSSSEGDTSEAYTDASEPEQDTRGTRTYKNSNNKTLYTAQKKQDQDKPSVSSKNDKGGGEAESTNKGYNTRQRK